MAPYKVLLTTSGTGSRLGELTRGINKALLPLNGRPTIEYILNHYPPDTTFVVTLGYLGDQVREALLRLYPDRSFEFVEVDRYEGPGTSLGYSMLQARDQLQCPFIFHACDAIVVEPIPEPTSNWAIGWVPPAGLNTQEYRTHKTEGGRLVELLERNVPGFDAIHIGITGVHDHQVFWSSLEALYHENPNDATLCDVHIIRRMMATGISFSSIPFQIWLDTGNVEALHRTETYLSAHPLSPHQ